MDKDRNTKVIVPQESGSTPSMDFSKVKIRPVRPGPLGNVTPSQSLDFDFSQYSENLPEGMTLQQTFDFDGPEYAMGEFQSGWEQAGYILPRIGTKFASEVAKLPGYLVGAGAWLASGANIEDIGLAIDNAWIRTINDAEESIKDKAFGIYKTYEETHGNFAQQVFSPAFWATEGADGIGFLLSMLVPGQIIKTLGTGAKVIEGFNGIKNALKLGKYGTKAAATTAGATAVDKVDGLLAALVNTVFESSAEAGETYKNIVADLEREVDENGLPKYTEEEIRKKAGENAYKVMKGNWAVLAVSNLAMEHLLFNQFKRASGSLDNYLRGGEKEGKLAFEAAKKGIKDKVVGYGSRIIGSSLSEGAWEEGTQHALQEYYRKVAYGEKTEPTNYKETLGGLINEYIDGLSTTEMQKSMFLGAVLGSTMSIIGEHSERKRINRSLHKSEGRDPGFIGRLLNRKVEPAHEGLISLLNNNITSRYQGINEIAELNEDGSYKYESDGSVKMDPAKVNNLIHDLVNEKLLVDNLAFNLKYGNEERYNALKEMADFRYMLPFLVQKGGLDALKTHIDDLAKLDREEQIRIKGENSPEVQSTEEIKEDLIRKAEKFDKVVKNINASHSARSIVRNLDFEENERKDTYEYADKIKTSKYQSYLMQEFYNNRLNELEAEIASLNPDVKAESSKREELEQLKEDFKDALDEVNESWDILTSKSKIKESFKNYIEIQRSIRESAKEAEQAYKESKETEKTSNNLRPLLEKLREVETFEYRGEPKTMEHKAVVKLTLLDPQTGQPLEKPLAEIHNGESAPVNGLYQFDKVDADGNLKFKAALGTRPVTIRSKQIAEYSGSEYQYRLEILKSSSRVREHNTRKAFSKAVQDASDYYNDKIADLQGRIDSRREKINELSDKLQKALSLPKTSKGKERKVYIETINGSRIYLTATEIQSNINEISRAAEELEVSIEEFQRNVNEINKIFEESKEDNFDVTSYIKDFDINKLQEVQSILSKQLDEVNSDINHKKEYISRLLNLMKGYHRAFLRTVDEHLKDTKGILLDNQTFIPQQIVLNRQKAFAEYSNLSEEDKAKFREKYGIDMRFFSRGMGNLTVDTIKENRFNTTIGSTNFEATLLEVRDNPNLTEDQKTEIIEMLIAQAHDLVSKVYGDNTLAPALETLIKNIDKMKAKVAIPTEGIRELENKARVLYTSLAAYNARVIAYKRIRGLFYQALQSIYPNLIDAETHTEKDPGLLKKVSENEIPSLPEKHKKDVEDFEAEPHHVFNGTFTDFVVSTGNTLRDKAEDRIRWNAFVATTLDFATGKNDAKKKVVKTYTFKQVAELPTDNPLRKQIKFWTGTELKTVEEIINEGLQDNKEVNEDIKVVVMQSSNNNKPYLVSEDGTIKVNNPSANKYALFSSLAKPTWETPTGKPRFSFKKRRKALTKAFTSEKSVPKELVPDKVEEKLKEEMEDALIKYERFRESLKQESKILNIARRNPGIKNMIEEWIDANEAIKDYSPNAFEIASVKKGDPRPSIDIYGSTQPAQNGRLYFKGSNRAELIIPKTLEQTGEIDTFIDIIRWMANNPGHADFKLAEDFLKQMTYFGYVSGKQVTDPSYPYRLFIKRKQNNKGNKMDELEVLVFGDSALTVKKLQTGEDIDKLREFLATKYHNFDKQLINSNRDFTELKVEKGKLVHKKIWKASNGGYRAYLFKENSKGVMNLKPLKSNPVASAQDPQYHNATLMFSPKIGQVPSREEPEIEEPTYQDPSWENMNVDPEYREPSFEFEDPYETLDKQNSDAIEIINERNKIIDSLIKETNARINQIRNSDIKDKEGALDALKEEFENKKKEIKDEYADKLGTSEKVTKKEEKKEEKKDTPPPTTQEVMETNPGPFSPEEFSSPEMRNQAKKDEDTGFASDLDDIEAPFREAKPVGTYVLGKVEQQRRWLKEKFGGSHVLTELGLVDGHAFGQFRKGSVVMLSNIAEIGTEFHEGFHIVYRRFTTPENQRKLVEELNRRLKSKYSIAEAEEILAEEFREYMLSLGNYKFGKNEIHKKNLFQKMWFAITEFVRKILNINDIETLFDEINKTKYDLENAVNFTNFENYSRIIEPSLESIERNKICK